MGGREIGSDGGGADLNLGTPPPPVPAKSLLIDRPPPPKSSPPPPARSSEKEAYGDEKAKAVGGVELAEVSKLPAGDAMEGWGVGGEEGKRRDEERRREVDRKIKGDWRRGREWLKRKKKQQLVKARAFDRHGGGRGGEVGVRDASDDDLALAWAPTSRLAREYSKWDDDDDVTKLIHQSLQEKDRWEGGT
ncbi:hypothetical protein BHM03_00046208 [Ensete ventricosum]|uniref:Uncharacterized protein n=1 Tax=Ensete ventricosum TaxID=4639 RepID=A0A445ML35_ENSVE|nr:hypothetical protein BHM03_00046208 [Ensete ventricosum]